MLLSVVIFSMNTSYAASSLEIDIEVLNRYSYNRISIQALKKRLQIASERYGETIDRLVEIDSKLAESKGLLDGL